MYFICLSIAVESSSDDDSSVFDEDGQRGSFQGIALSPTPSMQASIPQSPLQPLQQQQTPTGRSGVHRHSSETGSVPALATQEMPQQSQRASAIYANVSIPSGPGRDSRGLDVLPVARPQCNYCSIY